MLEDGEVVRRGWVLQGEGAGFVRGGNEKVLGVSGVVMRRDWVCQGEVVKRGWVCQGRW